MKKYLLIGVLIGVLLFWLPGVLYKPELRYTITVWAHSTYGNTYQVEDYYYSGWGHFITLVENGVETTFTTSQYQIMIKEMQ